jgi:hypothetical protein
MNRMKILVKIALLILAWLTMFFVLTIITDFTLVPWDTAIVRPEVGTWQRSLNDFFENPPGQHLFSIPIVFLSIIISIKAIRHHPEAVNRLLLIHLLFTPILFGFWMGAAMVNNAVYPYPPVQYDPNYPGYYRSVIPLAAIVVVCTGWFYCQMRLAKSGRPAILIS